MIAQIVDKTSCLSEEERWLETAKILMKKKVLEAQKVKDISSIYCEIIDMEEGLESKWIPKQGGKTPKKQTGGDPDVEDRQKEIS